MNTQDSTSPCGLQCSECEYYGKACPGCRASRGEPFWTARMKPPVCPIYNCCASQMKLEHCGLCAHMPCGIFEHLRDHALDDEEYRNMRVPEE